MIESTKNTVIIDYQLGNLFSVKQACETIGLTATISSSKDDIKKADAFILPGVGAFIEAMNNLKNLDLIEVIKGKVNDGTPIFGICLGLQLLFTESEEFGDENGLNLIGGSIKRFPSILNDRKIKVPHISWNRIYKKKRDWNSSPLKHLTDNDYMYFVHSYYVLPSNEDFTLTLTNYDGIEYCSSIQFKNIFATQFHPEKSAIKGLKIYENWAKENQLIK
jgi:glutamine amidotransferase